MGKRGWAWRARLGEDLSKPGVSGLLYLTMCGLLLSAQSQTTSHIGIVSPLLFLLFEALTCPMPRLVE